jgi:hypothetical protein
MAGSDDDLAKLREFAREQAELAAEYKMQAVYLQKENVRLRRRLGKFYSSWTWRAGRVVLFPYHTLIWFIDWVRQKRSPL